MPTLTLQQLRELERLYLAATAGPWTSFVEGRDHTSGSSFIQTAGADIELNGATAADQDFIAASVNAMPKLIAELAQMRGWDL